MAARSCACIGGEKTGDGIRPFLSSPLSGSITLDFSVVAHGQTIHCIKHACKYYHKY